MTKSRGSSEYKQYVDLLRLGNLEGKTIKFYHFKTLNYVYVIRHPKKLKVRIKACNIQSDTVQ